MMKFIEDGHLYFNDDNVQYTSVTTLVSKLKAKKDWDEIARKYAKKHKLEVEQVKENWKRENQKSIERGVKYHQMMEDKYLDLHKIFDGEVTLDVIPSRTVRRN